MAERLESLDSNLSAKRAHLAFGRLGPNADSTEAEQAKTGLALRWFQVAKPSVRAVGTALTAIAVVGAAVSWLSILKSPAPDQTKQGGIELIVDGNVFRVGHEGDVALAVPARCQGQPHAVLLDSNSVVWIFNHATDQQEAEAFAQIPGATNLIGESDRGCGRIWVTGPAGQSLVVGSD